MSAELPGLPVELPTQLPPQLPTKQGQRDLARAARKALSAEYREEASAHITSLLLSSQAFASAAVVASYEWMNSEVQTSKLNAAVIASGKRLIVPEVTGPTTMRFVDAKLRGREVSLEWATLIIVPCVGFDLGGQRIGNGRGYYDRALAQVSGIRCCVAFDAQLVRGLVVESTDATMDAVVTESGVRVGAQTWA